MTLEVLARRAGQWVVPATLADDVPVSQPPFDAITFPLDALWPEGGREDQIGEIADIRIPAPMSWFRSVHSVFPWTPGLLWLKRDTPPAVSSSARLHEEQESYLKKLNQ
ncbi:MAG: hypothetical protein OXC93_14265 [Rhodospirillaceae bacterium]|nr:hypothetical protein [Rhodospirillaceae bacterium]